jgi:hypothetical protein
VGKKYSRRYGGRIWPVEFSIIPGAFTDGESKIKILHILVGNI